MKRLSSLLLAAALVCGVSGCTRTVPSNNRNTYHTEQSFAELSDSAADAAFEIARARELLFRVERGEIEGIRAQELLNARTEAYEKCKTDAAIAYIRYCRDVTNEANKEAYDTLATQIEELSCILIDTALLLSKNPDLGEWYDAETVEALLNEDALSDLAVVPLFERERALIGAYEALPEQLTVERNGQFWTGDRILSDPNLSAEDFESLYEAYLDLFNAEAGTIFLDLIRVRKTIAEKLGYGSYAEYRYACFGRSYTPEDASELSERVKTELVPLFLKQEERLYPAAAQLYGAVFERDPTIDRIQSAVTAILPEMSEPWDYMISHGMIDLDANERRMPGSFTTYFAAYGAPFLFGEWSGGFDAIPAVIHEFGHYASLYRNGDESNGTDALDLAETDAQGLELLTVLQYDTVYGDLSAAAETAELFYALYALVDGCAEDAFQQFAYAAEEPTLEELNAAYGRICAVYGLDTLGVDERSWTQIPHTFQSPFYYFSYTTGTIAALDLFLMGKTDTEAALAAYRMILSRQRGAALSDFLESAGLADPFAPESVKRTAYNLNQYLRDRGENGLDGIQNGR